MTWRLAGGIALSSMPTSVRNASGSFGERASTANSSAVELRSPLGIASSRLASSRIKAEPEMVATDAAGNAAGGSLRSRCGASFKKSARRGLKSATLQSSPRANATAALRLSAVLPFRNAATAD